MYEDLVGTVRAVIEHDRAARLLDTDGGAQKQPVAAVALP
ncbi:DUF6296 family protein [Kitasatospora sp. NPDC058190]